MRGILLIFLIGLTAFVGLRKRPATRKKLPGVRTPYVACAFGSVWRTEL